ncbi:hypothetical protein N9B89_01485, partial [Flavobacteriales bacterium]|nr:hypothetical protein [Flavobacteriales bacterium]
MFDAGSKSVITDPRLSVNTPFPCIDQPVGGIPVRVNEFSSEQRTDGEVMDILAALKTSRLTIASSPGQVPLELPAIE